MILRTSTLRSQTEAPCLHYVQIQFFLEFQGAALFKLLSQGHAVNGIYCIDLLKRLRDKVQIRRLSTPTETKSV